MTGVPPSGPLWKASPGKAAKLAAGAPGGKAERDALQQLNPFSVFIEVVPCRPLASLLATVAGGLMSTNATCRVADMAPMLAAQCLTPLTVPLVACRARCSLYGFPMMSDRKFL